MSHIVQCSRFDDSAIFTRKIEDGTELTSSLNDVINGAFNEFRFWNYCQKHKRSNGGSCERKIDQRLPFIIAGYLDNQDYISAIDELSSPNHVGQCLPVDLIVRLLDLIQSANDESISAQIYFYLKRLFESINVYEMASEIVQSFSIHGRDPGLPSLLRLMKDGSQASYRILHLLLLLLRDQALSHYPNVVDCYLVELTGIAEDELSTGSRGNDESFWSMCMAGFQPNSPNGEKFVALAHDYLELGFMCLSISGPKLCTRFISTFYDCGLLRNTSQDQQRLFFDSCTDSQAAVQIAFQVLSRKFNLGPGPANNASFLEQHLELLQALTKLSKAKVNLSKSLDQLQYAAFLCAARPFFSRNMSVFSVNSDLLPWITLTDLDMVKQLVAPLLKRKDKVWNPYLVPYRVLFGKTEIEVIVIGSSSSGDETPPRTPHTAQAKRVRVDPVIID